jgi:hypothetical protein
MINEKVEKIQGPISVVREVSKKAKKYESSSEETTDDDSDYYSE